MEAVIIVAGGSGSRMKSDTPKQFLEIAGRPILMHTIEAFHKYSDSIKIILVLSQDRWEEWENLKNQYNFQIHHNLVAGGITRTDSVRNGLALVENSETVAIHDGVRPLVSPQVISRAFQTATKHSTAIVCVALKDSLRKLDSKERSEAVDRKSFRIVQTPQVFRAEIIKKAYQEIEVSAQEFTDDASVADYCGYQINLVEGDHSNIKITTPEDLILAESILKSRGN
jgi:2-C-methyl-D-erythritol 4-phosphate cytidylyltransferase